MLKRKVKVGVVGCGGICKATYMNNMVNKFAIVDVVGCYDLIESRMDYMVEHYGIKKYDSLEAIVSDPEIEVIVNLTYPESHFLVSSEAMKHGKNVYCEKMMAPDFEQAKELVRLAEENHVMYTTAPDTFLGAHEQSARYYIDQGLIGKPVTVHAQVTNRYQPNTPFFDLAPRYFFFPLHYGGGFPFDLGGYYIHEMINLFGSVKRITGFGGNLEPNRVYSNPKHPKYGEKFEVNTPCWQHWNLKMACLARSTFPRILLPVRVLWSLVRMAPLNWVTPICLMIISLSSVPVPTLRLRSFCLANSPRWRRLQQMRRILICRHWWR